MSATAICDPAAPEARDRDQGALLAHLAALLAARRPVPCLDAAPEDRGLWTSEDGEDQAFAARLCLECHGRTACAAFGRAWPKEAGVYGGATERDRRPPGRPRKTAPTPEEAPHV